MGTDYPGSAHAWRIGDATPFELMELVKCGLSPMETIVAATRTTAEAYRKLDEFGTLEPGKKADLLVVKSNPLDDIAVLYDEDQIRMVLKDGRVEFADEESKPYYTVRDSQPKDRQHLGKDNG